MLQVEKIVMIFGIIDLGEDISKLNSPPGDEIVLDEDLIHYLNVPQHNHMEKKIVKKG